MLRPNPWLNTKIKYIDLTVIGRLHGARVIRSFPILGVLLLATYLRVQSGREGVREGGERPLDRGDAVGEHGQHLGQKALYK